MMRNNSYRAAAALLLSVAAIAVVICVFSSADNEAALQEVGFPARNMQARMQRPMDFVAVERAAGMALDRDVSNFLMRRARGTRSASVMRKRLALANARHKMAPVQQLVATMASTKKHKGYYKDPVFEKYHVKDYVFDKTPGDPAMAKWIPHASIPDSVVAQGAFLESIADHDAEAMEQSGSSGSSDGDDYFPRAPKGSLSWDDVADKVHESGILKKGASLTPEVEHGTVPNAADNTVNEDGDVVPVKGAEGSEIDYSKAQFAIPTMDNANTGVRQSIAMKGGLAGKKPHTPGAPYTYAGSSPAKATPAVHQGAYPPSTMHQLVHDHLAAPGPAHTGVPTPAETDAVPAGSGPVADPSFSPPNTPEKEHDFDFKKTHDPDFEPAGAIARNVVEGSSPSMMETKATVPTVPTMPTAPVAAKAPTATKTAVDLAKKAMAEHAKKTATSTKIQQLRAATARKELNYKKAMALVSKTAQDVKH